MSNNSNHNDSSRPPVNRPPRIGTTAIFYFVLIALLLVFSTVLFGNRNGIADKTTLSDVVDIIENRDYSINQVDVNGTSVTVEYKDLSGATQQITQNVPYEYVDDLIQKLEEYKSEGLISS